MTEWRLLEWLPGYEVSEHGALRRTTTIRNHPAGRLLKGAITAKGYVRYQVPVAGRDRAVLANRLVCEAWHGPPPTPQHHSGHRDGNSLHNHYSNLRWVTALENETDKIAHGTKMAGAKHYAARLTWKQVQRIRAGGRPQNISSLARKYQVSRATIYGVLNNETWRAA